MRYVDGLQVLCQNHHTSLSCNFFLFMTGKSKKKKVRWEEANVLKPPTNIGICCNVQCHPKLPQIYANMNPMAHQVSKKDSERRPRQKLEHPKLKKMKKEKKKRSFMSILIYAKLVLPLLNPKSFYTFSKTAVFASVTAFFASSFLICPVGLLLFL